VDEYGRHGAARESPLLSLLPSFRASLPAGARLPADEARLEAQLSRLVGDARAAWPGVAVDPEEFAAYVAARLAAEEDVGASLDGLHAGDLFLACGCTRGDRGALQALESHFIAPLAGYLGRADALPAFSDEVKQAVRVRLLVAEAGMVPRIASYRGRGPLAVWLRLAATRMAMTLRQNAARDVDGDDQIARLRCDGADPELAFFKAHYRDELRKATEGALRALPDRDGNLLRLHFFEQLSADTIGAMHGVSGRTVQRWIAEIRERIVQETRRLLNERWKISDAQFESMLGLVGSQIEISVRRLLGGPGA
jgi:RNA polymerase sigma-70 factor, ECF subfamily